ncbi:hypothetical protein BKA83DRAFT_4241994 [Pisolithus microcarpus]|nr:hypothetical protein BKA83DRAFT_4241994 [Pisolithus microcarpus]
MSLSMLVGGGSECGPTNPLQGLTNKFDQDRGPQQDLLARAGPAKETFHTSQSSPSELQRDVARFFSPPTADSTERQLRFQQQSWPPHLVPSTTAQPPRGGFADAEWAGDFLQSHHRQLQSIRVHDQTQGTASSDIQEPVLPSVSAGPQAWGTYTGYRMGPASMGSMTLPMHGQTQTRVQGLTDRMLWDKEFQSQESLLSDATAKREESLSQQMQQLSASTQSHPTDQMARLAAQVIDSVKHEENPKFKNSVFMGLMQQLRDGEVVVDREGFVSSESASPSTSEAATITAGMNGKGKARAVDILDIAPATETHSSISVQQGDAHEAYFQQENEDFRAWWEAHYTGPSTSTAESSTAVLQKRKEVGQWHELQDAWEHFEATTTGVQASGGRGGTRHHAMHVGGQNVLKVEAAVQHDPLGVRQQSNERETKAVQALRRCLELDPSHLPACNRMGTGQLRNPDPRYSEVVKAWKDKFIGELVDLLIDMVRASGGTVQEVDAGRPGRLSCVDYSRALDCFLTALAVRPDDWLLYNRVGATMANSGRADEALQYYYRALELNPGYIRARYRYEEAATHILDALVLQDSEGGDTLETGGATNRRGVTSSALWNSLKTTCLHLQRVDLASMCDRRDLDGFRGAFQGDL